MTTTGDGDVPPQSPPPIPPRPPGAPASPPSPTVSRKRNRGWWWVLAGAVTASAVWAGSLYATGGSEDPGGAPAGPRATGGGAVAAPDLAGYRFTPDLCAVTDLYAFEGTGRYRLDPGTTPTSTSRTHPAADTMGCAFRLRGTRDGTAPAEISSTVLLHKQSDPLSGFGPSYKADESRQTETTRITVEEVPGLGDEAYLVTRLPARDSGARDLQVTLAIRERGMTYEMTWSGPASDSADAQMTALTVRHMLRRCAQATLPRLKS